MRAVARTGILVLVFLLAACGRPYRVERSVGREEDGQKAFFLGQIKEIIYRDGEMKIHWKVNNGFGEPADEPQELDLPQYLELEDKHCTTEFTIIERKGGTLTVTYQSTFDHRPKGYDLITIDSGRFLVRWQEGHRN